MKKTSILVLFIVLLASSCNTTDDSLEHRDQRFLISKVYDYQDRLLAEYLYNDAMQLTKRIFTDPTTGNSSDLVFSYTNNKVSEINYIDYTSPNFSNDMFLFYDTANNIIRSEIFINSTMTNHINYAYNSSGNITHFYKDDGSIFNTMDYDSRGNVISVTNCCFEDPITGEITEDIRRFTYDARSKPSFNLNYLFQMNLLPKMGSEEVFERNISSNNLTRFENSGTTWTYEFNAKGLPISILTEYADVVTDDPMLLKLEYISN